MFDEEKPYQSRTEKTAPWDETTVEWLCRRYSGLTPGMIARDVEVIRSIDRLPAVMHSEVVNMCVAVDDL